MSDRYYLTDGSHVLIAGATGAGSEYGGKTATANWWHHQAVENGHHDVGLYYDPKGMRNIKGKDTDSTPYETLSGLAEGYRSGQRLFHYKPSDPAGDHEDVKEWLRNLPGNKIVVHDEAQAYKDAESLSWFLSQGGNLAHGNERTGDIRSLVVTQRPWNIHEELRSNMPLKVWVGPTGSEFRSYMDAERMKRAGEQIAENTGAHKWSVTDAGDYVHTNPPVPEEYA
ncbi:hypothetical protein BRC81_00225 [Halobacteriales archaeon QS_1_68_20]|nr:MAG: hypothetical protein BRC81_00225 [Halobacteriales archaeon QS_1_68_20]